MKNATHQHEGRIATFLSSLGCTSIQFKNGGLVALRPGRDGRLYPLSIDLYEEDAVPSDSELRFRARAARRFGLPVSYHHGPSIESALADIAWTSLDRPLVPRGAAMPPVISGVL